MALELNGTTGVSLVQDGVVTAADLADGSVTAAKLAAGVGGKILQVQRTFQTNASTENTSIGTYADIVGVNITPSSTSNKILLFAYLHATVSDSYYGVNMVFKRNSTLLTVGDSAGSRSSVLANHGRWAAGDSSAPLVAFYLDSPSSTSQITYYISVNKQNAGVVYINRAETDTDNSSHIRATSALFALEVAS